MRSQKVIYLNKLTNTLNAKQMAGTALGAGDTTVYGGLRSVSRDSDPYVEEG